MFSARILHSACSVNKDNKLATIRKALVAQAFVLYVHCL